MRGQSRKLGNSYWCPKCRTYKAIEAFGRNRADPSGLQPWCKSCVNQRQNKYRNKADRFWKRFWERAVEQDGCLIWTGSQHKSGYPVCRWEGVTGKSLRRVVYQLSRGDLPDDMFIEMTCNNPRCVKQSHMRPITATAARMKMETNVPRGEHHISHTNPGWVLRGERRGTAKVTEADVVVIRNQHTDGTTQTELARRFGISRSAIGLIVRRINWKHVP